MDETNVAENQLCTVALTTAPSPHGTMESPGGIGNTLTRPAVVMSESQGSAAYRQRLGAHRCSFRHCVNSESSSAVSSFCPAV